MTPNYSRRARWAVAAFIAVMLLCSVVVQTKANATPPYGGCKEAWQAPHSAGADGCRDRGWLVKHRLVLDRTKRVVYLDPAIKPCEYEDGEHCYWNAKCMGNGRGDSYVRLNGHSIEARFGYRCHTWDGIHV